MGNAKGSYNRDENRNQEDGNTTEKSSKRHYDDASVHRDVNNLKEGVKVDGTDSFSIRSSNANKELDSGRESSKKARKQLEDNKNHIEWDGEKFVPKEMQLNRINLTKIHSKQVFEDLRIRASRTVTSICMSVKVIQVRLEDTVNDKNAILGLKNEFGIFPSFVHEEVLCDECEDDIIGFRYKCAVCPDYDLCRKCEEAGHHPQHFFIRVNRELPIYFLDLAKLVTEFDRGITYRPTMELGHHKNGSLRNTHDAICNECVHRVPITGFRYACLQCNDFDLCHQCETSGFHPNHPMLRIPHARMYDYSTLQIHITKMKVFGRQQTNN